MANINFNLRKYFTENWFSKDHKTISCCEERVGEAGLILEIDHIQVWRELILFGMKFSWSKNFTDYRNMIHQYLS